MFSVLNALEEFPDVEVKLDLTIDYVSQLESADLWEWSIYVLLNLPKYTQLHTYAIQNILGRHIFDLEDPKRENFLIEIGVPQIWIESAKAWKACYQHSFIVEFKHLIDSREYKVAYDVLLDTIAAQVIINQGTLVQVTKNPEPIKHLFNDLKKLSQEFKDWDLSGEVYLNYIDILLKWNSVDDRNKIQKQLDSTANKLMLWIEELDLEAESKSYRESKNLRLRTWHHDPFTQRVCLAQMSVELSHLMMTKENDRKLRLEDDLHDPIWYNDLQDAPQLWRKILSLDIPEDHRLNHLNDMTALFLKCTVK